MAKIDTAAADYALHMDLAIDLMKNRHCSAAVQEWSKALAIRQNNSQLMQAINAQLDQMPQTSQPGAAAGTP